jgi:hypothetical protein
VSGEDRQGMWVNFLNACKLGTVIEAADTIVWQKCDSWTWRRIGASGEYIPESISWPVQVLSNGIS